MIELIKLLGYIIIIVVFNEDQDLNVLKLKSIIFIYEFMFVCLIYWMFDMIK